MMPGGQGFRCDIANQSIPRVAESRPVGGHIEARISRGRKFARLQFAEVRRTLVGKRESELVEPRIVSDQQYAGVARVKAPQPLDQSFSAREVEPVLDLVLTEFSSRPRCMIEDG